MPMTSDNTEGYTAQEIEVTPEMVNRAWRVLMNWGGLRNRNLDEEAITKTMLVAALGEKNDG